MKPVALVVNILDGADDAAGAAATRGRFERLLEGLQVDMAHAFGPGAALPSAARVAGAAVVVVTGGPAKAYDRHLPWLQELRRWLARAIAARARILGICAGSQLLAMEYGGDCVPIPVPEIGCRRIAINDKELCNMPAFVNLVETHHETVVLPDDGELIALGHTDKGLQGFISRDGLSLGLQGHPEYSREDGEVRARKRFQDGQVTKEYLEDALASFAANENEGHLLYEQVLGPWIRGEKTFVAK